MEHLIKSQKNGPRITRMNTNFRSGQMQAGFSFVFIRVIRGSRFWVPAMLG